MIETLIWLVVLALCVACVTWTFTHEELTREPRDWLAERAETASSVWLRKLCFMPTCEYCLSHYVAAGAVALTGYQLLLPDWRGYLIGWLSIVALSNAIMSLYARVRVEIRKERAHSRESEHKVHFLERRQ